MVLYTNLYLYVNISKAYGIESTWLKWGKGIFPTSASGRYSSLYNKKKIECWFLTRWFPSLISLVASGSQHYILNSVIAKWEKQWVQRKLIIKKRKKKSTFCAEIEDNPSLLVECFSKWHKIRINSIFPSHVAIVAFIFFISFQEIRL